MQEPASVMNLERQEADIDGTVEGQPSRRRGPIKFVYKTGARPLDGYTIKRGIGAGGFGDVYYATSDAGKEVALKRIQRNLDVELRGVRQCLNLKHQNLVALFDIRYDEEQQAWVLMEYVSGESLHDVVERNPNGMPEDQVLRWLQGIVDGVAYLHEHGIVHRDLKPGNIFLDHDTVKIGDYGLSKFISCSRRSGQTESVGTFHYMAPEIGLGRYGKEIDIYGLGVLLYEMLTGRVPFEGESSQEIIMKHLTAQPELSGLPKKYQSVVARAMAKDPAERFRSARDMLAALQPNATMSAGDSLATDGLHIPPPIRTAQAAILRSVRAARKPAQPCEEPIAAEIKAQMHRFADGWRNLRSFPRLVAALLVGIGLLLNIPWLLPFAIWGILAYGGYYVFWFLCLRVSPSSTTVNHRGASTSAEMKQTTVLPPIKPTASQINDGPPDLPKQRHRPRPLTHQQVNDALREAMQSKTLARHGRELTGSMLMAAFVAAVLSAFMSMFSNHNASFSFGSTSTPLFIWLSCTSAFASWVVLFLGKLWEGNEGDQALRRFCMMVTGMVVGGFAYVVYHALMLPPVYPLMSWDHSLIGETTPDLQLYNDRGEPHPAAFAGYFGLVFLTLRWWLAADPLRTSRLSIWGTAAAVLMALIFNYVLPIPRGFLVVTSAIVAIQLAATWVDPRRRQKFREKITVAL